MTTPSAPAGPGDAADPAGAAPEPAATPVPPGSPDAADELLGAVTWARSATAAASLGAAVVHGAAVPVHVDHGTRYGVAFVVMTALGVGATVLPLLPRWRRGLWFALVANVAILGLWFLATNVGVPGDEKEAVGMAGAVASLLEIAAVTAAAIGLGFARRVERVAPPVGAGRHGRRAPVATLVAAMLVAAPGVATASDHAHGADDHAGSNRSHDHPNQQYGVSDELAASSISGIYSWYPVGLAAAHVTHSSGGDSPCAPSDDQVEQADSLVARTTLALQRWHDPQTAVAAGYRPLGFEPNGVYHYLNEAYLDDGKVLDVDRPEALLYGRRGDGSLFPVGAMFFASSVRDRGPRVGGCLTPWHRQGFPFAGPGQVSREMLHVWTIPVPGGAFAGHVEGDYARLYLGLEPVDMNVGDPTATDGVTTSTVPLERLTTVFGLTIGGTVDVGTVLNALNVHRTTLCAEPLRRDLARRVGDDTIMSRLCDPVVNGPLPGASAPPLDTVLRLSGGR
jgi:hypothetical protein